MPYSESGAGGAAGSVVIGNPVTGGAANEVLYEDSSQNLAGSTQFKFIPASGLQVSDAGATTNITIGSAASVATNSTAGTSIVIGGAATAGNVAGQTVVGNSADCTTALGTAIGSDAQVTGANGIAVGAQANSSTSGSIAIGVTATAAGASSTVLGTSAVGGTGGNSVVIGNGAVNTSNVSGAVLIGQGAAIGVAGNDVVGIGRAAIPSGGTNVVIGSSCSSGGFAGVVVLAGSGGLATANNQFVCGGSTPINNVYFGKGVTSATATAATINGTGGTGADNAGAALNIAGGISTGNAIPGVVKVQGTASARGASSSTAGTLVDRLVTGVVRSIANNTATTIVSATNANNTALNFKISYGVEVFNGTDMQYETGTIVASLNNKAGTQTQNTVVKFGNQQGMTAGTLTVTWTITAANPALIQVNANSSLTPSTGYPTITCNVENLTQQAFTLP